MSGIGINLREVRDDNGVVKLTVLGLLLDGPAQLAGVRQGGQVLAVNGQDVQGKSAFEVSSLLQGHKETFVTIKVKHGNCGPIQSVEVQRQLVARTPVFYRLEKIDNGATSIGYIRLKEFNALATKDLVLLLDEVTMDLDVVARMDLLKFFCEECEQRGATIVYATHIFDGLETWASHLAYIQDGELKRSEKVSEVNELKTSINLLFVVESWLRSETKVEKRNLLTIMHRRIKRPLPLPLLPLHHPGTWHTTDDLLKTWNFSKSEEEPRSKCSAVIPVK